LTRKIIISRGSDRLKERWNKGLIRARSLRSRLRLKRSSWIKFLRVLSSIERRLSRSRLEITS
jgi:hypothetical protein